MTRLCSNYNIRVVNMEVAGELKSALTSKPAAYVIGGTATLAAAYGLYKLWLYMSEEDEYFEKLQTSVSTFDTK